MGSSERIRKYSQRYEPGFGAAIQWSSGYVENLFYMICDEDYNINVDTEEILLLLSDLYEKYCMNASLTLHMR